jgi:thiamine biosynthesis lipoprotein
MSITRRRFIAISASAAACGFSSVSRAGTLTARWTGTALGASTDIRLLDIDADHANRVLQMARAEIDRLEDLFSLYRPTSELSRMNASGFLKFPSADMLSLLSLVASVNALSDGMFDPTIQPLWDIYARSFGKPDPDEIAAARKAVGWPRASVSEDGIELPPDGKLTLNGIAQGYVTDRVTELLRSEGLANALVNVGEIAAIGSPGPIAGWQVHLGERDGKVVHLRNRAVATSAPLGTVFGTGGEGHLIDPTTGRPTHSAWISTSIIHDSAAIADALSTAAAMMEIADIERMLAKVRNAVFHGQHTELGSVKVVS